MEIVGLFVGETKSPEFYDQFFASNKNDESDKRQWPEKEHCSAFLKNAVDHITVTNEGIAGNGIGFPTHIANAAFRTALVQHMGVYDDIDGRIPGSKQHMKPGCFGENILVSHPSLHPSQVCVGDVYSVNSCEDSENNNTKKAVFRVTGPRMPCPKVDAFLGISGVTALGRKTAWTGYFFQVLEAGECYVGDKLELMERPYPGLTLTKIQESLWGDNEQQDHSETFLETLAKIDCLIPRHYRETAVQRLERLR